MKPVLESQVVSALPFIRNACLTKSVKNDKLQPSTTFSTHHHTHLIAVVVVVLLLRSSLPVPVLACKCYM
jgi:hypothetical protein